MNEPSHFTPGSKLGVLLLHDVGAPASDLREHARVMARAGYTVSCPQLIPLGSSATPGRGSAGQLVSEAEQALARMRPRCESVAVVGFGYGAMLALELARHNVVAVQAVVLAHPRVWLPGLRFTPPRTWSGRINQKWLARLIELKRRLRRKRDDKRDETSVVVEADLAASRFVAPGAMNSLASLLDSVHVGLPAIRQPVLLLHHADVARSGRDGSFLLQRRLGGRVESVMTGEQIQGAAHDGRDDSQAAERIERFVASAMAEIETKRDNEQRRQRVANSRGGAA